jgi:pimeloyl-ACP methyl ester carboxylesterase
VISLRCSANKPQAYQILHETLHPEIGVYYTEIAAMNRFIQLATTKGRFFRRVVIGIGSGSFLLLLFVFLPAFTLAPAPPAWVPEPLAFWGFDMRLLISRPLINFSSLAQAVRGETSVTYIDDGQQITIQSNGLTIVGDLYEADVSGSKPAVLLLHGSTPQGRKLGLYRLMSSKLAESGYIVLAIDLRGFGQSDNPSDVKDVDNFNFSADVAAALDYLKSLPEVNPERIFLVGHSFGGDVAVAAVATQAVSVEKLVLLGPGRRSLERGGEPDAPEFEYFRRRDMRYMWLPSAIPVEIFKSYRTTMPLENHLDYFAQPTHTPLLLLDGELESKEDQQFLQEIFSLVAGKKAYSTLAKADHHVNVANFGPLILYDMAPLNQLLQELETFFSG